MDRSQMVIGFLLGTVVSLGAALVVQSGSVLPAAHGQTAGGGTGMFAVTGSGTSGQSRDVLFIVDPEATRLGVYEYKDGRLELTAIRNIEYDFRFQEWSARGKAQTPSVADQRRSSEEQERGTGGGGGGTGGGR
jgi:hypothetical protein